MSDLERLEECILTAQDCGMKYIGVKVEMLGFRKPEIIINDRDNFNEKLEYYKNAYDEDLVLKSFRGIRIVDFCCGNSFNAIEEELILYN